MNKKKVLPQYKIKNDNIQLNTIENNKYNTK